MTKKNQPIKSFKAGRISVSIFENTVKTKDKKTTTIKNAVFQKRYTDEKDQWKTTNSLNVNEIPKAMTCLQRAYEYLISKKEEA